MDRLGTVLTVSAVLAFGVSGCSVAETLGDGGSCHSADRKVVDAIMETAQRDFRTGSGGRIYRLDPVRTASVDLPEKERFGPFTMLVAIRSNYVDTVEDEKGTGNGVLGTDLFASNPTGTKLAEIDPTVTAAFDIPDPDDPGWAEWSKRTIDTDASVEVYHCAEE